VQLPVDRSAELQTTGLGAAFLAGLGVGMWPSFEALASTRHSSGVFEPGARDTVSHARWRSAVERAKNWAT
jgi:glycerol kinase